MRTFILGAAAFALAGIVSPLVTATPARAQEYPYCASGTWGSGGCSYATLEQCRAFINGAGGTCISNPRYTPGAPASERKRR